MLPLADIGWEALRHSTERAPIFSPRDRTSVVFFSPADNSDIIHRSVTASFHFLSKQSGLLHTLLPKLQLTCGEHGCLFTKRIKHETVGGAYKEFNIFNTIPSSSTEQSAFFSVIIIITINAKLKIITINKKWYFWQQRGLSSGQRRQPQQQLWEPTPQDDVWS